MWKAEQKHEAERKKIEELQKELKDERAREEMTRYAQETGAVKCVTFSQPQHHVISLQKCTIIYNTSIPQKLDATFQGAILSIN